MTQYKEAANIKKILNDAHNIVIIQADNPDGDSLASALALEQILHEMRKEPYLYCGVDIPSYLRYLRGWDRVNKDLPSKFDASILVDCSSKTLLETLDRSGHTSWLAAKPFIILDHHDVKPDIPYATVICNQVAVSTGEVIYELAEELDWQLNQVACNMLVTSILSDSLGLTTDAVTARSIHIVGELVEKGVKLAELEEKRRETMRKSPELVRYKGKLLERVEYHDEDRIATITIPWDEIEKYSPSYNPPMLVMDDMRLTENTDIAIAFKLYKGDKVTGKIRANAGKGIANRLAEHFGGGGHAYAAGFKVMDGRSFNEIKAECLKLTSELLDKLEKEKTDETV
jgi:phosphoesterase RecJ-like protein